MKEPCRVKEPCWTKVVSKADHCPWCASWHSLAWVADCSKKSKMASLSELILYEMSREYCIISSQL